jgi:hypothetical protein
VALLKQQLARLADQLTGDARTPGEGLAGEARTSGGGLAGEERAPGEALPGEARTPAETLAGNARTSSEAVVGEEPDSAEELTGEPETSAEGLAGETSAEALAGEGRTFGEGPDAEARARAVRSGRRLRGGGRPGVAVRPGRPAGSRRAARVALGALAGVAACSVVVGLGWLVSHSPGASEDSAGAKSAAQAPDKVSGDGGRPSDPELVLACSKLVVEGTVARVEPRKLSPWSRITLTVTRSYKPAHGPARVSFLLDAGAEPAPRTGQHVLVEVGRGELGASVWAVGETRVAADRAWIEKALPGSRHVSCPSDRSS